MDVQVDIKNMERIRDKLEDKSAMVGDPLRHIFGKGTMTIEREVKMITPVDTGRLRASWTSQVDANQIPAWGKMGTNVVYAESLERSKRRPRRTGQIPFFSEGIKRAMPKVEKLMDEARAMIAKHWGSK